MGSSAGMEPPDAAARSGDGARQRAGRSVTISVDMDTGALVMVVRSGPIVRTLTTIRTAFVNAKSQRPAGVILDLSALATCCVLLLLVLINDLYARSPIRLMLCMPRSPQIRALVAIASGLPVRPTLEDALTLLPGGRVSPQNRRSVRLPPTLQAATVARTVATDAIHRWELDHLRPAVELVIAELVSNAIRHAGTSFGISLIQLDGTIRIAVWDASPHPPTPKRHSNDEASLLAAGGRGLHLVEAFASTWGYVTAPEEKVVWAWIAAAH